MSTVLTEYQNNPDKDIYEKLFDKFSLTAVEKAVCCYYLAMHLGITVEELADMLTVEQSEVIDVLKFAYRTDNIARTNSQGIHVCMGIYQYGTQVRRYTHRKQEYKFNAEFLNVLCDTNANVLIYGSLLNTLPYQCIYLDYSDNTELCERMRVDGTLIQANKVCAEDSTFWLLLCVNYYKEQSVFVNCIAMPDDKEPVALQTMIDQLSGKDLNVNSQAPVATDEELDAQIIMFSVILQCVMYMCSDKADISETAVSKQRYRQAKQNKNSRTDKNKIPVREYTVGERFGTAFTKYKQATEYLSNAVTEHGAIKRPHLRRAHWHSYWTGKRDSTERKLVIRWVSEVFCGVNENESAEKLDVVKHKVQ